MSRPDSFPRRLLATLAAIALVAGLAPLGAPAPTAAVVLPAPTLTAPGSGEVVTGNPVFAWSAVSGATKYRIEVSTELDFSPLVSGFAVETANLRYAPPAELPLGTLYWRVAAKDASNTLGDYASDSFTKDWGAAPNPISPALNDPTDPQGVVTLRFPFDPLLFTWEPLLGAQSYELQVDDADDFIGATTYKTKNTAYVITEPRTVGQTFYWHLRAVSGSLYSDWSPTGTFRSVWSASPAGYVLAKPVLVYPPQDDPGDPRDIVTDVYFDWEPVLGAETYQLQVSPNRDWTNNKTIDVTVKSTRYAPPVPLNNGNYFWRVRALDAASTANKGPWSDEEGSNDARVFERGWPDKPKLLWPPDGGSTADENTSDLTWQNPTFSWTPAHRASWYRVRIGTQKNAVTGLLDGTIQGCITNRTTLTPNWNRVPSAPTCGFALTSGTTYYWDVAGIDHPVLNKSVDDIWGPPKQHLQGILGLRSDLHSFTWDPPSPVPGTIRPLERADYLTPTRCVPGACTDYETDTPVLTWTAIPGAENYRVTVALDRNFTNIYATYCTEFNRLAPADSWRDNQAGEAYYWNVTPDVDCDAPPTIDPDNYSVFQKHSLGIYRTLPAQADEQANDFTFQWQDFLDTNLASDPPGLTQQPTQEATEYRITTSTVSDFASTIETKIVNTSFYTPYDKTYAEGPIYWRVQAIDGSDNDLTWSRDGVLAPPDSWGVATKKSPAPFGPEPPDEQRDFEPDNGATVTGVPYLRWEPLEYAASYDVQIDNDENFSSPVVTATTKMTAWAYTEPLPAGHYFWRVRRNDADNRDGRWSEIACPPLKAKPCYPSFNLTPAAPTLVSPANGANPAAATLLLQWTSTHPAPKYTVEMSTTAAFTSQVTGFPQTTVMSAWAPKTLPADGTYYWRVKALNASGTAVATSTTFSFSVDAARPTVTALSPSSALPITSPITVTFSEPVTGVGDATFTVKVAGAAPALPGTIAVLSPTSARFTPASTLVPGQTYTVSLATGVTDLGGNSLVPYTANIRTSTTVQQDSPAVKETWARWSTTSASGGAMKMSRTISTRLSFTFVGDKISLVGYRGPSGGYASVYLDGALQTSTLSFYASASQYKRTLWTKTGLAAGSHKVEVLPRGTRPSSSKDTWVYVDAFVVDDTTTVDPPATVEESSASVVERFRKVATSSAAGGAYEVTSHVSATGRAGPVLSFQFKGTGVAWYGTKGPSYGRAYVYVDNVKKASIDLYRSSTAYKQKLWTSATLSNGLHAIKILVVGSKQSASRGYDISFDYFSIK